MCQHTVRSKMKGKRALMVATFTIPLQKILGLGSEGPGLFL
jgi:hypothetical protein